MKVPPVLNKKTKKQQTDAIRKVFKEDNEKKEWKEWAVSYLYIAQNGGNSHFILADHSVLPLADLWSCDITYGFKELLYGLNRFTTAVCEEVVLYFLSDILYAVCSEFCVFLSFGCWQKSVWEWKPCADAEHLNGCMVQYGRMTLNKSVRVSGFCEYASRVCMRSPFLSLSPSLLVTLVLI